MAVMDEFKEERAKVKEMPLRGKIEYFVYYHKVLIFMVVLIVILGGTSIYSVLTTADSALYIALIDCIKCDYTGNTVMNYGAQIAEQLGLDPKTHTVTFDSTFLLSATENPSDESVYQIPEILWTRLATGQLDAFVAQESTINGWVMNDAFLDLSEVMSEEQYEYYKDSFYWIDYAILEDYSLDFDKGAYVYNEEHRSPEGMKNPIPVGIYVTPCEEFQENYNFLYGPEVVYCLTYNGTEEDKAKKDYDGTKLALEYLDYFSGRITAEN